MDTSKINYTQLQQLRYENLPAYQQFDQIVTDKAERNLPLTQVEKHYICLTSSTESPIFQSRPDLRDVFDFRYAYFTYNNDLTGGSIYIDHFGKNIPIEKAQHDLEDLKAQAAAWRLTLDQRGPSETLLNSCEEELEYHMTLMHREIGSDIATYGRNRYEHKKKSLLLQSKFIYHLTNAIVETMSAKETEIELEEIRLHITSSTIVHIVSRHFMALIAEYTSKKSFHDRYFLPEELKSQLQPIFNAITTAGGLNTTNLGIINFAVDGIPYRIYTDHKANQPDAELKTFFPITSPKILAELATDYDVIQLSTNTAYYKKK